MPPKRTPREEEYLAKLNTVTGGRTQATATPASRAAKRQRLGQSLAAERTTYDQLWKPTAAEDRRDLVAGAEGAAEGTIQAFTGGLVQPRFRLGGVEGDATSRLIAEAGTIPLAFYAGGAALRGVGTAMRATRIAKATGATFRAAREVALAEEATRAAAQAARPMTAARLAGEGLKHGGQAAGIGLGMGVARQAGARWWNNPEEQMTPEQFAQSQLHMLPIMALAGAGGSVAGNAIARTGLSPAWQRVGQAAVGGGIGVGTDVAMQGGFNPATALPQLAADIAPALIRQPVGGGGRFAWSKDTQSALEMLAQAEHLLATKPAEGTPEHARAGELMRNARRLASLAPEDSLERDHILAVVELLDPDPVRPASLTDEAPGPVLPETQRPEDYQADIVGRLMRGEAVTEQARAYIEPLLTPGQRTEIEHQAYMRSVQGENPSQRADYIGQQVADRLYSQLHRTSQALLDDPQTPASLQAGQWRALLQKRGVKPKEMDETGLAAWLDAQSGNVTAQQIAEFVEANTPRISVTLFGGEAGGETRWGNYGTDGGISPFADTGAETGYGELVVTAPGVTTAAPYRVSRMPESALFNWGRYAVREGDTDTVVAHHFNTAEEAQSWIDSQPTPQKTAYKHSHWQGIENPLVHVRFDTRQGPRGERVLVVHELQSDWGQQGRKEGFVGEYPPHIKSLAKMIGLSEGEVSMSFPGEDGLKSMDVAERVTEAIYRLPREQQDEAFALYNTRRNPSRNSRTGTVSRGPKVGTTDAWTDLGLKAIMQYAEQTGHTHVAVAPGKDIAVGEGVGSVARELSLVRYANGEEAVIAEMNDGNHVREMITADRTLADIVGEEAAQALLAAPANERGTRILSGQDLLIGGKGHEYFYDTVVQKQLAQYAKKKGLSLAEVPITAVRKGRTEVEDIPLRAVQLTPEGATESPVAAGDPLYMRAPEAQPPTGTPPIAGVNPDGTAVMPMNPWPWGNRPLTGGIGAQHIQTAPQGRNPQTGRPARSGGTPMQRFLKGWSGDLHTLTAPLGAFHPALREGAERYLAGNQAGRSLTDRGVEQVTTLLDGITPGNDQMNTARQRGFALWLMARRLYQEIQTAQADGRPVEQFTAFGDEIMRMVNADPAALQVFRDMTGYDVPGRPSRTTPALLPRQRALWAAADAWHQHEREMFAEGPARIEINDRPVAGAPFSHLVPISDVASLARALREAPDTVVIPRTPEMLDRLNIELGQFATSDPALRRESPAMAWADGQAKTQWQGFPDIQSLLTWLRLPRVPVTDSAPAHTSVNRLAGIGTTPGTARRAEGGPLAYRASLSDQLGFGLGKTLQEAGRRMFIDEAVRTQVAFPVDEYPTPPAEMQGRPRTIQAFSREEIARQAFAWARRNGINSTDINDVIIELQGAIVHGDESARALLNMQREYWVPEDVADLYDTMTKRVTRGEDARGLLRLTRALTGIELAYNMGEAGGHALRVMDILTHQPQSLPTDHPVVRFLDHYGNVLNIPRTILAYRNLLSRPVPEAEWHAMETELMLNGRMRSEQQFAAQSAEAIMSGMAERFGIRWDGHIPGVSTLRDFVFEIMEPRSRVWYALNLRRLAAENGVDMTAQDVRNAVFRFGIHTPELMGKLAYAWKMGGLDPFGGFHTGSRPGAIADTFIGGPRGVSVGQRLSNLAHTWLVPPIIAAVVTKLVTGLWNWEHEGSSIGDIVLPDQSGHTYKTNLLTLMPMRREPIYATGINQVLQAGPGDRLAALLGASEGAVNYGAQWTGLTSGAVKLGADVAGYKPYLSQNGQVMPAFAQSDTWTEETVKRLAYILEERSGALKALTRLALPPELMDPNEESTRFTGLEEFLGLPEGAADTEAVPLSDTSFPAAASRVPLPGSNFIRRMRE
jgi:hypothetical protein